MSEEQRKELKRLLLKYTAALKTLETQISILIQDYEQQNNYNLVEHVKSRIKRLESAEKKLVSRNYEVTVENIEKHVHDMVGVRIVCAFLSDVYKIVEMIEKSETIQVYAKKDYIAHPKESGYSSYHLLVYVPIYLLDGKEMVEAEIQIRTLAMDFWASLDHKIQYKFQGSVPKQVQDNMYKCAIDINDLDHKMLILNDKMQEYKEEKDRKSSLFSFQKIKFVVR